MLLVITFIANSHCHIITTSDLKCNDLAKKSGRTRNKTSPDCQNMTELFSQSKTFAIQIKIEKYIRSYCM